MPTSDHRGRARLRSAAGSRTVRLPLDGNRVGGAERRSDALPGVLGSMTAILGEMDREFVLDTDSLIAWLENPARVPHLARALVQLEKQAASCIAGLILIAGPGRDVGLATNPMMATAPLARTALVCLAKANVVLDALTCGGRPDIGPAMLLLHDSFVQAVLDGKTCVGTKDFAFRNKEWDKVVKDWQSFGLSGACSLVKSTRKALGMKAPSTDISHKHLLVDERKWLEAGADVVARRGVPGGEIDRLVSDVAWVSLNAWTHGRVSFKATRFGLSPLVFEDDSLIWSMGILSAHAVTYVRLRNAVALPRQKESAHWDLSKTLAEAQERASLIVDQTKV